MLKILITNLSLDAKSGGGTAERVYQLTRSLLQLNVDCKVLVLDFNYTQDKLDKIENAEVITLPCLNKRFYIPKPSLKVIKRAVKDVDLIHITSHWTLLNVLVYMAAKQFNKPYVICPAGSLSYLGRSIILKKIYNFVIGNKIIRDAKYCIAITQDEIPDINKYGVNRSKIIHLPNGINEYEYKNYDKKNFRQKYGLGASKIILFVGRLNLIKGVDLLLDAFCNIYNQFPDYQLVIAGPDEGLRKQLENRISESGLNDRVKLIGYLHSKDKVSAYQSSNLLVIPSRSEAMSIVVLEAGISGKAVLITNKCGFNIIEKIDGGKVVEPSIEGIEDGMIELLSNEANLNKMGANLNDYVKQNYLWEKISNDYINLFRTATLAD